MYKDPTRKWYSMRTLNVAQSLNYLGDAKLQKKNMSSNLSFENDFNFKDLF